MKNLLAVVLVLAACLLVARRVKQARDAEGGFGGGPRGVAAVEQPAHAWPPVKGEPYPDLALEDHEGRTVRLSGLRGKVLVIEPIGIACPACNAFAGAEARGGFRGAGVQTGLGSIDEHLSRWASTSLGVEPDLVLVQLLLFDTSSSVGNPPTAEDAREWAEHFRLDQRKNVIVLRGTRALANGGGYAMVPGFQVVDRKGVLRFDGSGHSPADDPYRAVLGSIPDLLRESP